MSEPTELARVRATRELERSKAELEASLRLLGTRVRDKLSPSRAVEARLGWFLAGAFAVGVSLAVIQRRERSW
jgi:hypothetical protein